MLETSTARPSTSSLRVLGKPEVWTCTVLFLLVALTLGYGMMKAYPIFDDGWLYLLIREHGIQAVHGSQLDRPLYGWLLEFLSGGSSTPRLRFALINILTWFLLAVEGAVLWTRLHPDRKAYGVVVALLIVTPVIVQAQLCTVTIFIPCTLASGLGYASLLALHAYSTGEGSRRRALLLGGVLLCAASVFLSEYGVAVSTVGIVLLGSMYFTAQGAGVRNRAVRAAGAMGATTAVSYAIFLGTADLGTRPNVQPGLRATFPHAIVNVATGVWRTIFGAYGSAVAQVNVSWGSKTTLVAGLFGMLIAALLVVTVRAVPKEVLDNSTGSFASWALLVAVIAGLVPVAFMGRSTVHSGTGTRFLLPVLPVALIFTLNLVFTIVRERWRAGVMAMVGLIAGYSLIDDVVREVRFQKQMNGVGEALKPYVLTDGFTVAVVSHSERPNYTLTAKAVVNWDSTLPTNTLWLIKSTDADSILGRRSQCTVRPAIDTKIRLVDRVGPINQSLWIELNDGRTSIEPYCVGFPGGRPSDH